MCSTEEKVVEKSVEGNWRLMVWQVFKDDRISEVDKLKTFRQIRSLGVLPPEATFFLIDMIITWEHEARRGAAGLDRIENELGAIEDRHGEASKRYQALERKWEAVNRKLAIKAYEEFGEPEMARLLAEDEPKFDSLIAAGRDYFHRVYNPEWATEATDCRAEARRRASRGEV